MTRIATILCVDDEGLVLEGLKMLLEEQEYCVLVTTKATEALQLFSLRSVDLVLLDYRMPEMNGDVVAEHMKATKPYIPVAMLSGDEDLAESTLRSVDVFVSKSESPARLLEIVTHVLDLYALSSNSEPEGVARYDPLLRNGTQSGQRPSEVKYEESTNVSCCASRSQ
jgi:DNA-binding NtrC family response regulator